MPLVGYGRQHVCECGWSGELYVRVEDAHKGQPCPRCKNLCYENLPDRHTIIHGGAICYGPSHEIKFGKDVVGATGPRDRARRLKEKGYVEIGNEKIDTVNKYWDGVEKEIEAKEDKYCEDAADAVVSELAKGGGLYTDRPDTGEVKGNPLPVEPDGDGGFMPSPHNTDLLVKTIDSNEADHGRA